MKVKISAVDLADAIYEGNVEEVRELLIAGADPNRVAGSKGPSSGLPALANAICRIDVLATIASRGNQSERESVRERMIEIIRLLIAHGADLNQIYPCRSPLNLAVAMRDPKIVKILLDTGANPEGICVSDSSSLAKQAGKRWVNGYLRTSLHEAVEVGNIDIAELLLKAGADPNAKDHLGRTPEDVAITGHQPEIAMLLRHAARLKVNGE